MKKNSIFLITVAFIIILPIKAQCDQYKIIWSTIDGGGGMSLIDY
jgi:hypothetical protein